jgi:hypothetical protein
MGLAFSKLLTSFLRPLFLRWVSHLQKINYKSPNKLQFWLEKNPNNIRKVLFLTLFWNFDAKEWGLPSQNYLRASYDHSHFLRWVSQLQKINYKSPNKLQFLLEKNPNNIRKVLFWLYFEISMHKMGLAFSKLLTSFLWSLFLRWVSQLQKN